MSRLTNKPPLTVVGSASTVPPPPRKLGEHGMDLWNSVQREYGISDIGGIELLCLAAQSLDRAESLSARIAEDGEDHSSQHCVTSWARAFIARTLVKLGICTENVKVMGRSGSAVSWVPTV
jgi:hypothetical protein